ncbi:hypothetical protein [Microbacterium sp.]|uniref:hypothetical protein n=1 Tax=Microbacterium sp. TaxID=51671 RepID=UPI0037354136
MIENFLRRPTSLSEWVADGIRLLGILGAVAAFVFFTPTDGGIVALALPALMVPRFLGARAGFDVLFGVVVTVAAWSNVLHLYRTLDGWDLVVHFVATAVIAAMTYLALRITGVVPEQEGLRRVPIVLVPTIGLAVSGIWEVIEWAGKTFVTDEIFVTYQDTIGDLVAGGAGAFAAGLLVASVRIERLDPTTARVLAGAR